LVEESSSMHVWICSSERRAAPRFWNLARRSVSQMEELARELVENV
jgi:hypothetical protein